MLTFSQYFRAIWQESLIIFSGSVEHIVELVTVTMMNISHQNYWTIFEMYF